MSIVNDIMVYFPVRFFTRPWFERVNSRIALNNDARRMQQIDEYELFIFHLNIRFCRKFDIQLLL